jgi:hypothetical protein
MSPRTAVSLGVVGVCAVAVAATLAVHGAHESHAGGLEVPLVPEDLLWPLVLSCGAGAVTPIVGITADGDGRLELDVGTIDEERGDGSLLVDDDGIPVVDEEQSRRMDECTSAYRVDLSRDYRSATDAERLLIYDWAVEWQAPCLEAHGYEVTVRPYSSFVDRDSIAWFLLSDRDWVQEQYDFDDVLAARLACPPVPPFLAADGVGW